MCCYNNEPPAFTKHSWTPPPLCEHYKNDIISYDKPILTINNKSNKEWGDSGIFNYFDVSALEDIFNTFQDDFQIIYIRPTFDIKRGFHQDIGQSIVDIGDEELLKRYPNVISISNLLENHPKISYNEMQFLILANSSKHISSAGEAVIPACFKGDVLIYNHPNCVSSDRGVWKTDSWLQLLSGSVIYGCQNYDELLHHATTIWKI